MNGLMEEQFRIITKGCTGLVGEEGLTAKLKQGRPLVVKLGLDPSAPDIHLGHAVVLRKLRQMQELGHEAVIIIGDFTGRIGDPTGKSKSRNALSEEQVMAHAYTYQEQIFKILNPEKTKVKFNSEWLSKLNFEDVVKITSSTTVARMLERDDFQKRYKMNTPIRLHEFFYPLMQAYDSVETGADIEVGGIDQTFNILMGRNLQKSFGKEQQVGLFMPILVGIDGVEKMSKSLGNYIGISEDANVMFQKVMHIPDEQIISYYELATDEHPNKIDKIKKQLEEGANPRDIKWGLAKSITLLYHSKEETEAAIEFFEDVFYRKEVPKDIKTLTIEWEKDKLIDIIPLLVKGKYAASNSELRRLIQQGGLQINGEKAVDLEEVLFHGDILKIGKKNFLKIVK